MENNDNLKDIKIKEKNESTSSINNEVQNNIENGKNLNNETVFNNAIEINDNINNRNGNENGNKEKNENEIEKEISSSKNNDNGNDDNKTNIHSLIKNKSSIFRIKKKKVVKNNDDELKKISEIVGSSVSGMIKQDELEKNVMNKILIRSKQNQLVIEERRLNRAISVANITRKKIDSNFRKLMNPKCTNTEKENLNNIIRQLKKELKSQKQDIQEIKQRINEESSLVHNDKPSTSSFPINNKDYLIRTGKITPFDNITQSRKYDVYKENNRIKKNNKSRVEDSSLLDDDNLIDKISSKYVPKYKRKQNRPKEEILISLPEITEEMKLKRNIEKEDSTEEVDKILSSSETISKKKKEPVYDIDSFKEYTLDGYDFNAEEDEENVGKKKKKNDDDEEYRLSDDASENESSEEIVVDSSDSYVEEDFNDTAPKKKNRTYINKEKHIDDGDEFYYQRRLSKWVKKRRIDRLNLNAEVPINMDDIDEEEILKDMEKEMFELGANDTEISFDNGYRIPNEVYSKLFQYQQTCIKWLWELHCQDVGGIIGDEMGLGKTIQTISFIYGLAYSGLLKQPAIIVCPATLMKQWVEEFHEWAPPLRIVILHSTGSGMPQLNALSDDTLMENLDSESEMIINDDYSESEESNSSSDDDDVEDYYYAKWKHQQRKTRKKKRKRRIRSKQSKRNLLKYKRLVDRIKKYGHVLITTYEGLRTYKPIVLSTEWSYAFLDEGHKIRNPDSEITLLCKKLKTTHRILLSGTPIQNSLKELWSLFDFIYPGRLGTLPMFIKLFEIPIKLGGYATATNQQIKTSIKCATALRDSINPYMLRRLKVDVASDLPKKTEHVLFCMMTDEQKYHYKKFIVSSEVNDIYKGKRNALFGIDILRKICNHPDLLRRKTRSMVDRYGYYKKSGKMIVVKGLLKTWFEAKNKVLLFCQTRQMMEILEMFLKSKDYNYRKMDGDTPIKTRVFLVDEFNSNNDIFVFLLTTKVGGLGINLCSANRVIIFDPDWNPSTDMQARERAWRLGQKRDVAIFRIMAKGTVEEKIYHRQIYKQFLTNKILIDPNHQRFFKQDELMDLFSYNEELDNEKEKSLTGKIMADMDMNVEIDREEFDDKLESTSKSGFAHNELLSDKEDEEEEEEKENEKEKENNIKKEKTIKINNNKNNTNNYLMNESSSKSNNFENYETESTDFDSDDITESEIISGNDDSVDSTNKVINDKKIENNLIKAKYITNNNPKKYSDIGNTVQSEIQKVKGIEYAEELNSKKYYKEEEDDDDDDDDGNNNKMNKKKKKKNNKGKGKGIANDDNDMNVDGVDEGSDNDEEDELNINKNEYESKDEMRILKNLMKVTGAVGVIEHDKIMNSQKWDDIRDNKEAERVANNAIRKLRKFMEKRKRTDVSIPTWTGSSGQIGNTKANKKPRFGQKVNPLIAKRNKDKNTSSSLITNNSIIGGVGGEGLTSPSSSSSSILNNFGKGNQAGFSQLDDQSLKLNSGGLTSSSLIFLLSQKNQLLHQGEEETEKTKTIEGIDITDKEQLIISIREYMINHNGQATSKELLEHFKMRLSKNDIELFRKMLQGICHFMKLKVSEINKTKGYWVLKDEFK